MLIDLSLGNAALYAGLDVRNLAGRLTLITSPDNAIPTVVANLALLQIPSDEVTLTGASPIWVYLVVFHFLHGKTTRIYYIDGRDTRVLIAAHG